MLEEKLEWEEAVEEAIVAKILLLQILQKHMSIGQSSSCSLGRGVNKWEALEF